MTTLEVILLGTTVFFWWRRRVWKRRWSYVSCEHLYHLSQQELKAQETT